MQVLYCHDYRYVQLYFLFKNELFEDHSVHGWVISAIKVNVHKSQHSDLYEVIFKFEKKI